MDVVTRERGSAQSPPAEARAIWRRLLDSDLFVLGLTVVLIALMLPFTSGRLLSQGNLLNVASNFWPLLLVVIGQTFVLIAGGIDLSQTAILAFTGVFGAMLVMTVADPGMYAKSPFWGILFHENGGVLGSGAAGVIIAWLVMVGLGALIGSLNGFSVARIGMPPFMVTLTMMLFMTAFTVWSTKSENILNLPPAYGWLANGWVAAAIAGLMAVLAHVILSRSVYGHWLYATGINRRTAEVSGVPVRRVILFAYVLSGAFTALGAALYTARLGAGRPTLGSNLLMDVIGAAVIGGVSLMGGRGRITGAALGVLFFVVLTNALNLMGLEFYTIMWIKGAVILLAVAIDVVRTRLAARS
ncbi:MAG: ABC transporter permease [Propionibacteriaceae bacterium]|nr:ABC transporter permease [Propionibacteriaceae bacterium]